MRFDPATSPLAGIDTPTLQGWLRDAQNALADISTGKRAVTITMTGGGQHREVTYQKSDMPALMMWIRQLQAQLGIIDAPRRSMRAVFN